MLLYNGLNSTNKQSAWEEMNHLCYGWDGVNGTLVSAPNTGGGRKLFSICICTVYLILQVNKAYSE